MNKKLIDKIDAFLAERRPSGAGGGWAEITPEDIIALSGIINSLIKAKCEEDADGDYPIEFKLVNRRTHYMPSFMPVRYHPFQTHEEPTAERLEACYRDSVYNLLVASSDFETAERMRRLDLEQSKKDKK